MMPGAPNNHGVIPAKAGIYVRHLPGTPCWRSALPMDFGQRSASSRPHGEPVEPRGRARNGATASSFDKLGMRPSMGDPS
jgi:hypothetical protein